MNLFYLFLGQFILQLTQSSNDKAIVQRKFIHIKHNKFTNKFDNNYIYMYNKVTEVLYEYIKNC